MALEKQVIPIPFGQGVDTKTDPKEVKTGKLTALFNGVFKAALRLSKRFGYSKLSNNVLVTGSPPIIIPPISSGIGLKAYRNELDLVDDSKFYAFSDDADQWVFKSNFTQNTITSSEITSQTDPFLLCDSAYNSGLYCHLFTTNTTTGSANHTAFVVIQDATSGALLINSQLTTSVVQLKVVALGVYFLIVYYNVTANQIQYIAYNTSTNTFTPGGILASDYNSGFTFDLTVVNNHAYFCYSTTGTSNIAFYFFDSSLVVSSKIYAATGPSISADYISITGDSSNNIWLTYVHRASSVLNTSVYSEFISSVVLPDTTSDNSLELADCSTISTLVIGTNLRLFYTIKDDTKTQYIKSNTLSILGVAGTPNVVIRSVTLFGKCFLYNGSIYYPTVYSNDIQPTIFLIKDNGASASSQVVGKILNLKTFYVRRGNLNFPNVPLVNVNQVTSTVFQMTDLSATLFGSSELSQSPTTKELVSNFLNSTLITFKTPISAAVLANDLHLSSGLPSMYDGSGVYEIGFNVFPDYLTATASGSAGGLQPGVYQYTAIYEFEDSTGNHQRSAPAEPVSVTIGAANVSANVTVPMLRLTAKGGVIISVYRTTVNGSTFRRVTGFPSVSSNLNNPQTDSLVYHDTQSDTDLENGDILYTTGGEVENIGPPAALAMTTYRSRMILVPSENTNTIWYSKEVGADVPVEFSDLFTQGIDELGGPVTAVIQMDDKLIIFKNKNIFYMTGQGPAPNGSNNDFSSPLLINSDVGCVNQQSLLLMPNGVMFKSQKGIYLLDRSLQASYIGAEVEAYNTFNVTSAQLQSSTNQVRFTLDNGTALLYDYFFQQWSVFTNVSAVDSCLYGDTYTYLKSDGSVYKETTQYNDGGAFYSLNGKTAWFSMAGNQGFQRVWKAMFLGDKKGNHILKVKIRVNFDDTVVQTVDIDATAINPTVYQWRVFPTIQKCEAIQFEFEDVQTSGFNEGFDLSDLTLEIGTKSGVFKLPASQSAG